VRESTGVEREGGHRGPGIGFSLQGKQVQGRGRGKKNLVLFLQSGGCCKREGDVVRKIGKQGSFGTLGPTLTCCLGSSRVN